MDEELFLYSSHNKNKDNNEIKDGKLKTDKSWVFCIMNY